MGKLLECEGVRLARWVSYPKVKRRIAEWRRGNRWLSSTTIVRDLSVIVSVNAIQKLPKREKMELREFRDFE